MTWGLHFSNAFQSALLINDGSGNSKKGTRLGSAASIAIIVCVVGVVVFAAVAFLIRKRFVATHQHHRASMPSLEKETQESA